MKDVKTLVFYPNPNYSIDKESEGEWPPMFMCPITKIEFNGIHPFMAIWTTGYVISEKAIKSLGIEGLQEYGPFTEDDLIRLLPSTSDETDSSIRKMVYRRNQAKVLKKIKSKEDKKELTHDNETINNDKHINKKRKNEDKDENKINQSKLTTKISNASSLVKSAADQIKQQETSSSVFKNLFHKDHEKDRHDRDLFMTVAGIRYTIN